MWMLPEWHPVTITSFLGPVEHTHVVVSVDTYTSTLMSSSQALAPSAPVEAVFHSFIEQSSEMVTRDLSVSLMI